MKTGAEFLKNLLNALLPNRAAPCLGRVMKSYEGPGKNKYSCDEKVLKAGSLEETDQEIAEVSINPIWATTKKRGVYAIPNEGQVIIVNFLEWNIAYPYMEGVYSDEYEAGEYKKNQFVITDGDGMNLKIDHTDKYILIDTGKNSSIKLEEKKITLKTDQSTMVLREDKFSEKNRTQSLYKIQKDYMNLFKTHTMVGPPPQHKLFPPDVLKIQKIIMRHDALME
jgi:hypothetical protein